MLVTSLDLSFIWVLIHWDRHCQHCNFRHAVNYSFKFYGAQRLNGYMGNVQLSTSRGKQKKEEKKERMDEATSNYMRLTDCAGWCWRESWSLPALYKYLMGCLEAGPVRLKSCNHLADESVWCHSCYCTVYPLTKRAFKHISNAKLKPRCLTSITAIKNSHRKTLS